MTLTIKNKLILLGALSVAALSFLSVMMYQNHATIKKLNDTANAIQTDNELVTEAQNQRFLLVNNFYSALMARSSGKVPEANASPIHDAIIVMGNDANKLLAKKATYLDADRLQESKQLIEDISSITQVEMPKLVESHAGDDAFSTLSAKLEDRKIKLSKLQDSLYDSVLTANTKAQEAADLEIDSANKTLLIIFGLSLLALLPLVTTIILSITRPLRKSTQVAEELAHGNYTMNIEGLDKHDELGKLSRALNDIKSTVADYSGQIVAIGKSQAVIEFKLDGTIITANDNFLNTLGYALNEIKDKHTVYSLNRPIVRVANTANFGPN